MSAAVPAPGPPLADFEALEFDVDGFDHAAHVYVAWQYVRRFELLEAISRYRDTLRRLTAKIGVPGKYHETITWFFVILIADRARRSPQLAWPDFEAANPDLFCRHPGILEAYYPPEQLDSAEARQHFVLPPARGPLLSEAG